MRRPAGVSATERSPRRRRAMPLPAQDAIKLKDPSQFRYIGTGKLKLVDAQDIATGKAQYGMDTRLPGMLYAVVARPQVYGGKVVSVDDAAALKVPGVVRVVQNRRHAGSAAVQSARRRRRDRAQHLGGDAGAQRAEDRLGRRPERELRLRCLQGDARGGRAQARHGRAQRRRLRRGGGRCREAHHRGILPSASRARVDGAAGGERSHHARQVRSLGLLPVAAGRARPGRQAARHAGRKRHGARHAARRRIRAQVQARLRHRGGRAVQGDGRQAGQGRVDARRRSAQRLFPHGVGRASRSGRRCARKAGGVAASQRRADDRVDLRRRTPSRRRTGSSAWASSTCPSPFPTSASRIRKRSRTRASAGSARCRTFRMRSRCSRSSPSWPRRRGATRRTSCSR